MKKPKKKDIEKEVAFKIKHVVTFKFIHYSNVQNVALALSRAGYFVRVTGEYEVSIYSYSA